MTNARGLREAGVLPDAGPGLAAVEAGMATEQIRAALISGELKGLLLFGADPLRDFPDTPAWEEALTAADFVVSFSAYEDATAAKADVVLPLETHAEKDGTLTHPDGRLQRVRPSAGRPGVIQSNLTVLAELGQALGLELPFSQPLAFAALTEAVPFYASITEETIGGQGIRWQETASASALPGAAASPAPDAGTPSSRARPSEGEPKSGTGLALGTYRDLWAGPVTELNPPLGFLKPGQRLEMSPVDAHRLELSQGDAVRVSQGDSSVEAEVLVKERVSPGVVFLAEGVEGANANALLNGGAVTVQVEKLAEVEA